MSAQDQDGAPDKTNPGDRIAKFLARAGIASRRDAEKLIAAGRVKVNGKMLSTPAFKVTAKDKVEFDDIRVHMEETPRLWRYYKPVGLLTSHKDPQGRQTVFDSLPKDLPRLISVGRLDLTSEGLLLLTNHGGLARALELPATGWLRRYRARAYGQVSQYELDKLKNGIEIDGIPTGPIEAALERQQRGNAWITVSIREGKNREVRRALDSLGLKVNRLIRVSYGPFQLGQLDKGVVEEVKPRILREQAGHLIDFPPLKPIGDNTRSSKPHSGKPTGVKTTDGHKRSAKSKDTKSAEKRNSKSPNFKGRSAKNQTTKPKGKPSHTKSSQSKSSQSKSSQSKSSQSRASFKQRTRK